MRRSDTATTTMVSYRVDEAPWYSFGDPTGDLVGNGVEAPSPVPRGDKLMWCVCLVGVVCGCGQSSNTSPQVVQVTTSSTDGAATDGSGLLLKEAPADSKGVIAARESAQDGDDIVIEGRIGGDVNPWVDGRAAFLIVDHSLIPCNERPGDDCTTPWDYCCDTDRLPKSKATVKFLDKQGKTVATDARQLLGLKELQTVVVRGQAKRDEAGNLTVIATGLFVKPTSTKTEASESSTSESSK